MATVLKAFWRSEGGATAIEYGLIAALVALGIVVAATTLGGSLQTLFDFTASRATEVWNNAGV